MSSPVLKKKMLRETGSHSITAKRHIYNLCLKKLQSFSMFLLTLMREMIRAPSSGSIVNPEQKCKMVRDQIAKMHTPATLEQFSSRILAVEPHLSGLIQKCVWTAMALSCLPGFFDNSDQEGLFVTEPLTRLFVFLTRLMSERPVLVLTDDDERGTHVSFLQNSMEGFIAECCPVKG